MLPLKAIAASFTEMYIFGDSLSDTGNIFDFTAGNIPPSPPFFEGRFSNRLIWIDYLAEDLGLNPITYADVVLNQTEIFKESTSGVCPLKIRIYQEPISVEQIFAVPILEEQS